MGDDHEWTRRSYVGFDRHSMMAASLDEHSTPHTGCDDMLFRIVSGNRVCPYWKQQ